MNFEFRFTLLALPVLLALWMLARAKSFQYKRASEIAALLLAMIYVFSLGRNLYTNLSNPPEWDFLTFWVDGQIAAHGKNFYEAVNYQAVELPYSPTEDFRKEILDVGFRYPPFTMILFLPLGYFGYAQAYLFWQVLNVAFCFTSVYLLWSLFLKEQGAAGFYFVLALMFMLSSTFSSFFFAQTNFIALTIFLLFWRFRTRDWSGVLLALGLVVKPYMVLIFLYPVLARRWKQLSVALISIVAVTLLSGVIFGFDVLRSFLIGNSLANLPAFVYSELVNQSLLAMVLRSTYAQQDSGSLLMQPLYIGLSLLMIVTTAIVGFKNHERQNDWFLLSILFLAFLVYPATLTHYGVFLLIPVLLLLQRSHQNITDQLMVLAIILVVYFLAGFKSGYYTFYANAVVWLVCIVSQIRIELTSMFRRSKKTELSGLSG